MLIFIRLMTGKTISLEVKPSDSIEIVKEKIEEAEGLLAQRQTLVILATRTRLEDGKTLSDYNIGEGSTVQLILQHKCAGHQ